MDIACYMTAAFLCVASQLGTTDISVWNAGLGAGGTVTAEHWSAQATFFTDVLGEVEDADKMTEICKDENCVGYLRRCDEFNGRFRCSYTFSFSIVNQSVTIEADSEEAMIEAQQNLGLLVADDSFDAIPFSAMNVEAN